MKCPHCQSELAANASHCPQCGFSEQALAAYLGQQWIRLERVNDTLHALRLEERQQLDHQLDDFERQFPQSFLAVYIGALPPQLNPVEMGMWLLNHGAYSTYQFAKRNDYGLVCTLDPTSKSLGFAVGYGLEPHLSPSQIDGVMKSMTPMLRRQQLGAALGRAVRSITRQLRRVGTRTEREIETPPMPTRSGNPQDFGLTPLRQGHRPAATSARPITPQPTLPSS